MNSHEVFIHIHQGCIAGTGAIVRLPQCQWSKPAGYGKISQCITTTKHSKAKTVCIFLGIYCRILKWEYPNHVYIRRPCWGTNSSSVVLILSPYVITYIVKCWMKSFIHSKHQLCNCWSLWMDNQFKFKITFLSPNVRHNASTQIAVCQLMHYNGVMMGAMASQITSLTIVYLTIIQAQIKENIKAPRHWPLCGEFTGDRWIPCTDGQQRGKCFHLMTSSCKYKSLAHVMGAENPIGFMGSLLDTLISLLTRGMQRLQQWQQRYLHDDIIKWEHFPRNWPFVRGIHRSRWIPNTKASDTELWCFLWSASE